MIISMWVLIDKNERILYTGNSKMMVEMRMQDYIHIPGIQVVELKGEINNV